MRAADQKLSDSLAKWMVTEHARFHELKRVPSQQKSAIFARAKTILENARKNKSLRILEQSGFTTRYEVLMGNTKIALENLIRKKSPSRDLEHLGLELKEIVSPKQLREAMRLQKRISLQSKKHGYFSHTDSQLKQDEAQYARIISGKMQGYLLGVYRGTKILGLMMTSVHAHPSSPQKNGGFSFFLDRSIQGKGITKTGYLLLLEYLRGKRIRKFYGGTSQPAIQGLGKTMKRQVQHVIFVKM